MHANQTTGFANGSAKNWAREVEFSHFCALSRHHNDVLVLLLNQPNTTSRRGIRQLAISFDSIFFLFFYESSWGPCS